MTNWLEDVFQEKSVTVLTGASPCVCSTTKFTERTDFAPSTSIVRASPGQTLAISPKVIFPADS